MSFISITTEMPILTAVHLNEPGAMQGLLKSLQEGTHKLHVVDKNPIVQDAIFGQPEIEVDNLSIVEGNLDEVIVNPHFIAHPDIRTLAHPTSFAVWNQAGETHIVEAEADQEWSNDLIPAALLKLIPREFRV